MECLPTEDIHCTAMINEWTRLYSFMTFPPDSAVRPILLRFPKAGFYYTGSGEEVACFCCGLKIEFWPADETAFEVHRRLSPHCRYICGGDTTNITIHGDNRLKTVPNYSKGSYFTSECGKTLSETQSVHFNFKNSDSESDKGSYTKSSHTAGQSNDTGLKVELYPRISGSRPKYSDYALLSERLASSSQWPERHGLEPQVLAKAGFYSAEKQRLLEENRRLKDLITCKICLDNDACVVFLPCGHLMSCIECSKSLRKCAICRTVLQRTVRVNQS
ncbi:E3 ubiquitin-protein ligase XIAP-like [Mercenaria mercenaria]|uniref:E3 ubiquitin-protein ligase XIAP-like n=1 Tax=Mercenaria mercenaria TaxID=6596 RepID=UPI00234E674F|nr:E3 ubiquitin-protein ligase XIAP-like [Mercenaria mercenaria]